MMRHDRKVETYLSTYFPPNKIAMKNILVVSGLKNIGSKAHLINYPGFLMKAQGKEV